MSYSIVTRDGIKVDNIPDDVAPDSDELKQRVARARAELKLGEPEKPRETPDINQDIGPMQAAAIAAGRGMYNVGRGLGIADPESPAVTEQYNRLQDQNPVATTVGEIAGEAAPFLVPGSAVGGTLAKVGASTIPRALAAAGLGAAEGAIVTRGKGGDTDEQLLAGGVGGTVAGALDVVLPRLGRIGGKVIRKALGRAPAGAPFDAAGNPSRELLDSLDRLGLTPDDLVDEVKLSMADDAVNADDVARKAFLESQGIAPTKAQMTRDAADFQAQQEAAKTSGRVRQALEGQEAALSGRFDDVISETAGDAFAPTSSVSDVITRKATALDSQISQLYKAARESAPTMGVKPARLVNFLKQHAMADRRAQGNVNAMVGELKRLGIVDDGLEIQSAVDINQAEALRQFANSLHGNDTFANALLRQMKDALDDDVMRAAGRDYFKQARNAKTAFHRGLERAKVSKFDTRKKNIVQAIVENQDSVNPEDFTDKVVFGRNWRASDLQQAVDYLTDGTGDAGQTALNDLRAETLQLIKERAFIGPEDANGFRALSRDKLQNALKRIGPEKMRILFTPDENKFLRDMLKVAQLREPVRGTALGRGPSAQAMKRLEDKLNQFPILGAILDVVDLDSQGRAVLKASPRRLAEKIEPGSLPLSQFMGAAAASTVASDDNG